MYDHVYQRHGHSQLVARKRRDGRVGGFQKRDTAVVSTDCHNMVTRDSAGTGIGTVPARNSVVSVRSRNIFCSGAGPCKTFSLDLLPIASINVYFASCVNT